GSKPDQGQQAKAEPRTPEAAQPSQPSQPSPSEAAKASLADARENQKAIADELQKMLDGLSEFETHREAVNEAKDLLKRQEEALKQSAEAAAKPDLMGKTPDALTNEQKAQLENLAARQNDIAKGLQNLEAKMDELAKRAEETDPLSASALAEASQQSRKQGTSAKMGQSAEQLEKNQMGSARSGQEQARKELKDLVDTLQNSRDRNLARLVKELKKAEADLKKLRERQTQNLDKTKQARKDQDAKQRADKLQKLAKEQAEIQKEMKRQLQRLAKLRADAAAQAGSRASGKMGQAQQDLDQDQGEQ